MANDLKAWWIQADLENLGAVVALFSEAHSVFATRPQKEAPPEAAFALGQGCTTSRFGDGPSVPWGAWVRCGFGLQC